MAKTIQIRVDDQMKELVDDLFAGLGLDTSTAVRMFFTAALEEYGFPFPIKRRIKRKSQAEGSENHENAKNTSFDGRQVHRAAFEDFFAAMGAIDDEPLDDEFDAILAKRVTITRELDL